MNNPADGGRGNRRFKPAGFARFFLRIVTSPIIIGVPKTLKALSIARGEEGEGTVASKLKRSWGIIVVDVPVLPAGISPKKNRITNSRPV